MALTTKINHAPPVETPPPTYDICGLTALQVRLLRMGLEAFTPIDDYAAKKELVLLNRNPAFTTIAYAASHERRIYISCWKDEKRRVLNGKV